MDATLITAWAAMATAAAAILAPTVTTLITSASNIRLKKLELKTARQDAAVKDFAENYAKLVENIFVNEYTQFLGSAYSLLACTENKKTRAAIALLVQTVIKNNGRASDESNALFVDIAEQLANEL